MLRRHLLVAAAALGWGTWKLFLGPAHADPRWSAFCVYVAMSVGGGVLLALRSRDPGAQSSPPTRTAQDWAWLVAFGLFDAANGVLFFAAMTRTTVALAVLSHYLAPALVTVLAPWVAGTPRRPGAWRPALAATAGLVLVLEPWNARGAPAGAMAGVALGAGSAVFYALNVCICRRIGDRFSAEAQLAGHAVVAALVVLPFLSLSTRPTGAALGLVVTAAVLLGAGGGLLFLRGAVALPAEHTALLTFLEPVSAVLVGVLLLGEPAGRWLVPGALVVLGAGISTVLPSRAAAPGG